MKLFKINDRLSIICESQKTRSGFRHLATQTVDRNDVDSTKMCYQNRTWERFQFESVLEKLADKITPHSYEDAQALKTFIANYK